MAITKRRNTSEYDPLPYWIAIQLNTTILNPPYPWTEVALAAPLIVGFGLECFLVGGFWCVLFGTGMNGES